MVREKSMCLKTFRCLLPRFVFSCTVRLIVEAFPGNSARAQLWDKNQIHWKLSVQIKSSDKPPCHWHGIHWKCTSQSLTIYHRPEKSTEPRDISSKATRHMKSLSAEQRTGEAPPQQIRSRRWSNIHFSLQFRAWSFLFNLIHWFSHRLTCRW